MVLVQQQSDEKKTPPARRAEGLRFSCHLSGSFQQLGSLGSARNARDTKSY